MSGGSGGDQHETLTLRLEVGHESVLLAEPRTNCPGQHTHRWTVFVRGPNESVLDPKLVQKVIFHLHEDFPNPKRSVSSPPFEVKETGYGGFVIPIYVFFAHSKREHYLEYDMNLKYASYDKNKETKVIEFKDPKPELRSKLLKAGADVSSNTPPKGQGSGNSFQALFGETLRVASPSIPSEKAKLAPPVKRQPVSPSSNGSASKVKPVSVGKAVKTPVPPTPAPISHKDLSEKKHRKSKDGGRQVLPNKSFCIEGDNQRPLSRQPADTSFAAHCLADVAKLPPFVSPLNDCAWGHVPDLPSTPSSSRDERRRDECVDDYDEDKVKKASKKFRREGAQTSTGFSPTIRNSTRIQNGVAAEDKGKRKKTKSDSGLDSDYSSGLPNAHSPCVANGQHPAGTMDNGNGNALFSPPDSVRSLDTLQESPASAASSSSGRSGASSANRVRTFKDSSYDDSGAARSTAFASSEEDRLRVLLLLQQKIMTIQEKRVAQLVADTIASQATYDVTPQCLEFDLCSLDSEMIHRLLQLLELQV